MNTSRVIAGVRPLVVAAVLSALVVGACRGDEDADRDAVAEVADLFARSEPAICERVSERFLDRYFNGRKRACQESARKDDAGDAAASGIEVDGDKATALVTDKDGDVRVAFLRRDGEWLADSVARTSPRRRPKGKAPDPADKGPKSKPAPRKAKPDEDRAAARGAVAAFLQAAKENDERVLCGLLSERFARRIVRVKSDGIARCVSVLKGQDLSALRKRFKGAKVEAVKVDGDRGKATLTSGVTMSLLKEGDRFVITDVSRAG